MTEAFSLDTSGRVECATSFQPIGYAIWSDLTPFAQGYAEAAIRAAVEARWPNLVDFPGGPEAMARTVGFSSLSREAVDRIIADCAAFERHYRMRPFAEYRRARGESFWKQRAPGHRTSDFAPIYFPPLTVTLGDDGRVYLRERGSEPQPRDPQVPGESSREEPQ